MVNQFVRDEIGKLLYLCRGIHFDSLVGASGSFEVIANMQNQDEKSLYTEISIDDFEQVYESIIVLNLEERLARKDIPNDRASLIVVAFQLMHYLLTQIQCDKIIVSKYAMKEGMLTTLKK